MQCDSWTPLYNIRGREANPSHSPYTLPSSVSRKSCICHSCENTGGVGVFFPIWKTLRCHDDENLLSLKFFLFTLLRTLWHDAKLNSFLFKRLRTLYPKTPGVGEVTARVCRSYRGLSTANSEIVNPSAAPRNTSDGKCACVVTREKLIAPAAPYATHGTHRCCR